MGRGAPNRAGAAFRHRRAFGRAFTLIELVVTLAVMGLLLALVAAAVGRTSRATRQERALGELVNMLTAARTEALRRSVTVDVRVSLGGDAAAAEGGGPVGFRAKFGDRERRWPAEGLTALDPEGRPIPACPDERWAAAGPAGGGEVGRSAVGTGGGAAGAAGVGAV
ncbi:MAG: prepilin-type N-terminal cleavage/methylation domain-containing protein, partial [Phycisphaerales bacterium]|nr:prepilin-type N-terminal cleavage/methylation domain-containing protein [Phycisphaerales bacterium]